MYLSQLISKTNFKSINVQISSIEYENNITGINTQNQQQNDKSSVDIDIEKAIDEWLESHGYHIFENK